MYVLLKVLAKRVLMKTDEVRNTLYKLLFKYLLTENYLKWTNSIYIHIVLNLTCNNRVRNKSSLNYKYEE